MGLWIIFVVGLFTLLFHKSPHYGLVVAVYTAVAAVLGWLWIATHAVSS